MSSSHCRPAALSFTGTFIMHRSRSVSPIRAQLFHIVLPSVGAVWAGTSAAAAAPELNPKATEIATTSIDNLDMSSPCDTTPAARCAPGRRRRSKLGKSGAGYTFTRDVVLGLYSWTLSDLEHGLELKPAEQNQALCGNKVDAIILEAGHPNGLTQAATTGCQARLVRVPGPPIERLLATFLLHRLCYPRRHVRRQPRRCPDNRHAGCARHIEQSAK